MANTTWSTTDGFQITLSGGNLTATATGPSAAVRAVNSQRSGKYYIEYTMAVWGNGSSQTGFTANTNPSGGTNAVVILSGAIYVNGVNSGFSLGARASGNIIGVALDLGTNNIWFRVAPSGNWNGSGTANPATNTGGISVSVLSANGMAPVALLYQSGEICTANFGDSAFNGTVPSGFTGGFPAPVLVNTTWNPADASNIVLTLNSQTASAQGLHFSGGVRSVASKSTGKYYWEYACSQWSSSVVVGVANASAVLGSVSGTSTNACVVDVSGSIYINNSGSGSSLGARANGDVIGVALDLANQLIWFRVAPSGNWNGSGTANPATGIGGISITALSTPIYALVGAPANVAMTITAVFGDSPFVGAVPSGFTSGFSSAPPPIELAGNLGAASHYGRFHYGLGHYSRGGPLAPLFSGGLSFVPVANFVGGLTPTIVLAADLDVHVNLIDFSGNLAPQITLGGSLSLLVPLDSLLGSFGFRVVYGAAEMISGPLWADSAPCPVPPWMAAPPCSPVVWSKSRLCNG